jgi:hypothetical protein
MTFKQKTRAFNIDEIDGRDQFYQTTAPFGVFCLALGVKVGLISK